MKNPWRAKPLLICATPIVGVLIQIIILGFSSEGTSDARRNAFNNAVTIAVLFLPLVSLPALWAAVGGLKTNASRLWYVAGTVLNSIYCLLLLVPILSLAMFFVHGSKK